jgi:hypothetical protein
MLSGSSFQFDKSTIAVAAADDPSDEKGLWLSKAPEARLEALEFLRQTVYGYDPATARLQRVLKVVA